MAHAKTLKETLLAQCGCMPLGCTLMGWLGLFQAIFPPPIGEQRQRYPLNKQSGQNRQGRCHFALATRTSARTTMARVTVNPITNRIISFTGFAFLLFCVFLLAFPQPDHPHSRRGQEVLFRIGESSFLHRKLFLLTLLVTHSTNTPQSPPG